MKYFLLCLFVLGGFLCASAFSVFAGDPREIELMDGSVVIGEILSLKSGVYTVVTKGLGEVEIDASQVRTIRRKSAGVKPGRRPSTSYDADLRSMQEKMLNNKQIVNKIYTLQRDPEFMRIMQDPAIKKALLAGDIDSLISNPEFLKLLNNKTVQEIQKDVIP